MTAEERAQAAYEACDARWDHDQAPCKDCVASAIRAAENDALERAWRAVDSIKKSDNWERITIDDAFECALAIAQQRIADLKTPEGK